MTDGSRQPTREPHRDGTSGEEAPPGDPPGGSAPADPESGSDDGASPGDGPGPSTAAADSGAETGAVSGTDPEPGPQPERDSGSDASVDPAELVDGGPILLFDGVCNLCNGSIQFVIRRDPEGVFRYAPLQSAAGRALLEYADVDIDPMEGFVMIDGDDAYVKSGAALRVAGKLGLPWSLARPLVYVPRVLRDFAYDLVAANRYRVFGKKDRCMIPDDDVSDRFLNG